MPGYSFWQDFEECDLVIENAPNIVSVKISRDNNYNLNAIFTCTTPEIQRSITSLNLFYDDIFKDVKDLKAYDSKFPMQSYELTGILITLMTELPGNKGLTYSGIISDIKECYNYEVVGNPTYSVYWFLNGSEELSYTEGIRISEKNYEKIEWGTFCEDEFEFKSNRYFGRDAIKLKFKEYEFLFGRVKKDSNELNKSSFIRFRPNEDPTYEEIKEICMLLSYVLGVELICIGNTKYNSKSFPVYIEHRSTFRKDIDNVISSNELPPLPVRIQDCYSAKIEPDEQINMFIQKYLNYKEALGLESVIWYINYARSQHPMVKIQPLSTAFDMLCTAYFAKKPNTHILPEVFNNIMKELKPILKKYITNEKDRNMLAGKFTNCNSLSLNKRNKALFTELGLELSELELTALNSRNKVIHGSVNDDSIDSIIQASAYTTLMSRLLLSMIGMDYYIDYSQQGVVVNSVHAKQGGKFNVRKI